MVRKTERLYIFTTSSRPDPYVNSLVYVTNKHELNEIHFISIIEHDYLTEAGQERAARIMGAAQELLEELAKGRYIHRDGIDSLSDKEIEIYQRCLGRLKYVRLSAQGVRWADLADALKAFSKDGGSLFDVTALKKNLLVDAVALLLSQGESEVWTFELMKSPSFGVSDLVHSISEDKDFKYRCLTASKHVEAARRRMILGSITLRRLFVITAMILVPVVLVQVFWPDTVIQSVVVALGTATSIAGWLFFMRQRH